MPYTPHPYFRTRQREALWAREALANYRAGRGAHVFCNICGLEVVKFADAFDESHHPDLPRVFGGKSTAIAHSDCNRRHGAQVVRPLVAKCDRVRARHLGLKVPGKGCHPLPAGVATLISKTMRGRVVPRLTLGERLARLRALRSFTGADEASLQPEQQELRQ